MIFVLIRKNLRDLRVLLLATLVILMAFEGLWVKVTQRITGQLIPFFQGMALAQKMSPAEMEDTLFQGPGKIVKTLMGGERIKLENANDMLSIGYVHPLVQTILCIWAIARAAGAIAGELDRGTMELLLAQPVSRSRLLASHLAVDLLTIPLLCFAMWMGTWLGTQIVGPIHVPDDFNKLPFKLPPVDAEALTLRPAIFLPGLLNVAALIFAVSGYTMWLSAAGRFRSRVLAIAMFVTLVQFLVNLLGQLWETMAPLRPLTVFYYYQPQQIDLSGVWTVDLSMLWGGTSAFAVNVLFVLVSVGVAGYGMAWWTFCRRDLPAPL